MPIGYARVSTSSQDLTAQRNALEAAGVDPDAVYTDHGYTGTNRDRPGLGKALAACREGDTLVVTKLTASRAPCRTPGTSRTNSPARA
ncbi:DNA invertase Pin-like site-specific DNA recombinase [Sinomonas atrocyanea]|nr:DNA invertase Pin-like site-specific DNA recombinase [Sinomonas atrocyanea]